MTDLTIPVILDYDGSMTTIRKSNAPKPVAPVKARAEVKQAVAEVKAEVRGWLPKPRTAAAPAAAAAEIKGHGFLPVSQAHVDSVRASKDPAKMAEALHGL